ncbi:hypothetical protein EHF_0663 [Ehrlichia japonica]|uniref:Uncharacterized protein n=1 Tax=Ehrlichia japonica TaxID=391036 RepID=X5GKV9_9RICK|nr:hypothetical protein EHF_0663 [Ehrlichia japonica]
MFTSLEFIKGLFYLVITEDTLQAIWYALLLMCSILLMVI